MIIKIQRPLMTNGNEPMALIYDQTRRIVNTMFPYAGDIEQLFSVPDGEEQPTKIYHKASLHLGQLAIEERVEDQDW